MELKPRYNGVGMIDNRDDDADYPNPIRVYEAGHDTEEIRRLAHLLNSAANYLERRNND